MARATVDRTALSASDWTAAALAALAAGGLAAIAVEPIARSLGATKGSFYWHFANRNDLVTATLELWERRDTDRVIAGLEGERDALARLGTLLRRALLAVRDGAAAGAVELALQASADDPAVATVLTRVTQRRMEVLTDLFTELGLSRAQARNRALLAYSAYLGHAQLAHATPDQIPGGRAFRAHVDQAVETLLAGLPEARRRVHGDRAE